MAGVDQVTYLYLHAGTILSFEERAKRSDVGGQRRRNYQFSPGPLTHTDIPELVRAVVEALLKKDPSSEPRAKEGEIYSLRGELFG